jgi:PASTA domain/Domain of unknown function (DUF5122) beta-propeller
VTSFSRRPQDVASALARQPDGALVVGGGHATSSSPGNFALARYHADGTLDRAFGSGGLLQTDLGRNEEIVDLARQPDGKLVALGLQVRGESWASVLTRYLSKPRCVVPDVRHDLLRQARIALAGAGCRVGRVRHRPSRARPGTVIGQRPGAGAELPRGGKVNLVLSRR